MNYIVGDHLPLEVSQIIFVVACLHPIQGELPLRLFDPAIVQSHVCLNYYVLKHVVRKI